MKQLTILLFALIIPYFLSAQHSISGQVFSEHNQPIEFATVSIYPIADSTNIRGVISEKSGKFKIDYLKPSDYQLIIQMLGYEDWEKEIAISADVDLATIILKEETALLKTVEVVAEQSTVESRLGKKVLRIGQDLSNTGSNALEALDNIPSITTTQRGQVQIRGNSNVIIYINGKETRRDPATLKYISAEVLEKIEVITNPSAKYDAEGVAGIINLVYKKGKTSKFKLESIANISNTGFEGGLNASVSKDKFSFFTNISAGYDKYKDISDSKRTNFHDSLKIFENNVDYITKAITGNFNTGISLEPDSTLSMGLEFNYDYWDFKGNSAQKSIFNYQNETTQVIDLKNNSGELENELWVNFSLEKEFKSEHNLTLSLTTGGEDEENFARSEDAEFTNNPIFVQQFLLKSDETESQRYYQGKLDFNAPFFKFGEIEAGIKADIINYDILQKAQLRSTTIVLPDNNFSMDMQKLGAYILQTHQIKKLEYSLGLRLEQFKSDAIQRADESTFLQKYLRLFPSLQFNYLMPDRSHSIGFNYTRRINRPGFFDLNPFISYEDPLNLETGNPALRPEIADLFEVNYHKGMDKLDMDITLYRRKTNDAILATIQSIDDNQSLEKPINFAQQINQGIEGQLEYRFNKFIKATTTFVWGQVEFSDTENDIQFNKNTSWATRFRQQFKLPNNWKIDLSQIYRAPQYEAQSKSKEVFYMNIGIGKKFNNKRGSISIGVRDILNTRQDVNFLQTADFQLKRRYKWQTRQVTLGFRYFIFQG